MSIDANTVTQDRRLIVIGAGDLAREICGWFPDLKISGFLDSHVQEWAYPGLPPIIGTPETYQPEPEDIFLCAVGNPAARLSISRAFEARGAEFATLIHHTAAIVSSSSVGPGTIMLPMAMVDVNVKIGKHSILYFRASVGHDVTMGDGCVVLTNAVVGAKSVLGDGVVISTLAFCNPGTTIGSFAQIGANSFAPRDVPAKATAIGVPARIIMPHAGVATAR